MSEKKPSWLFIGAVAAVTLFSLVRVLSSGGETASTTLTVMTWTFIVLGVVGVIGMLLTRK